MSDMKNLNRELTDDELENIAGGELSESRKRELLGNISLAKMAGWSMEKCIKESCMFTTKQEREEFTAFIKANW